MNAYVMLNDPRLLDVLESSMFSLVVPIERGYEGEVDEEQGALIISEKVISNEVDLLQIRDQYRKIKMFYLVGNSEDFIYLKRVQAICAANDIHYMSPYHITEQIVEGIVNVCFGKTEKQSKVIAAMSTLPQMGLTSSLLVLATTFTQMYGVKVGVLGLNGWNPGDSFIEYKGKYLDEINGEVSANQLLYGDLSEKMHEISPGVFYLAGNRDVKKLYYYSIDSVSWLIQEGKKCFDILFIDVGSYLDHALAAQSLYCSDFLIVQTDQRRQSIEQWYRSLDQIIKPVLNYNMNRIGLLFNQMYKGDDVSKPFQLSRQMDELPFIASLPRVPTFYAVENEKKLLTLNNEEYRNEIVKACKFLGQMYNLTLKDAQDVGVKPSKSKQGFIRRLIGVN